MFYAAVEMRDQPDLVDKPMAVGGMGMLSTSNYKVPITNCTTYYFSSQARRFGVRAAMPGFIAKKLCPHLVIVPTNMAKYAAVAEQVNSSRLIPSILSPVLTRCGRCSKNMIQTFVQ